MLFLVSKQMPVLVIHALIYSFQKNRILCQRIAKQINADKPIDEP